jgi:hypothetical protein
VSVTIGNKYAGTCDVCGREVPAGAGIAIRGQRIGTRYGKPRYAWAVRHRPKEWHGSPVSGRWVGGCSE